VVERASMQKVIVFDLDGVVIDSRQANFQAFAKGIEALGLAKPSEESVVSLIGLSAHEMLVKLGCPEGRAVEIYESHVKPFYLENLALLAAPVPGAVELFEWLRQNDWKIGACTSGGRQLQVQALKGIGLLDFFSVIQTPDDSKFLKPAPEFLLEVLRKMGLEKEPFWHIEDSSVGLSMGLNCGAKTVFANYGFGTPGDRQPHYRIDSIGELRELLS
jgi:phosphoglycolate phosphatase